MIQLTRLRHDEVFFLNPDLIERIDTHVDTVVRLTNGSEYVVVEPGPVIVERIAEFRAKVLAVVPLVRLDTPSPWPDEHEGADGDRAEPIEIAEQAGQQ